MNIFRKSVALLLLMVLMGAMAVSAAGFEFSPDPVPDQDQILENREFTLLEEPPRKFAILRFDVNEDGRIAIGTEKGETKIVSVCDPNGVYQSGFTFQDRGDFGLQWEKEDLLVYSVRSNLAFRVSPAGEVTEIQEILINENNNSYWYNTVYAKERRVGSDRYYLTDDMGILNPVGPSYSQLVVAHADGTEQLLYDVNSEQLVRKIAVIAFMLLFVGIVFYVLTRQFKKMKSDAKK